MKKLAAILMACLMLLSLTACQGSTPEGSTSAPSSSAPAESSEEESSEVSIAEATFNIKKDYGDSTKLSQYMDLDILTDKTKTDVLDRLSADCMTVDATGKIAIADGISVSFYATLARQNGDSYLKTKYGSQESTAVKLGENTYALDDENKQAVLIEEINTETVKEDPVNGQIMKYLTDSFMLEDLKYHENGVARYKGEQLTYEEYTSAESALRLYYDGNDLKYISNTKDGLESVITINTLTDSSDPALFAIPEGYQIVTETSSSDASSEDPSSDASSV